MGNQSTTCQRPVSIDSSQSTKEKKNVAKKKKIHEGHFDECATKRNGKKKICTSRTHPIFLTLKKKKLKIWRSYVSRRCCACIGSALFIRCKPRKWIVGLHGWGVHTPVQPVIHQRYTNSFPIGLFFFVFSTQLYLLHLSQPPSTQHTPLSE